MHLKSLELSGFKSFAKKTELFFDSPITAIVGPNGSGKSNVAEAFRWVLGEQSLKSLRGRRGEDLIFNGSTTLPRLSRAKAVLTFDNQDRQFNLDFDEVVLAREVHRDGINEYTINGSPVRLRDVLELLANVSLGSTGHHIISQGEADRLLNAGRGERREMIEEALGLKIYQWKIAESEKKLARSAENLKQVESLRREITPHLKFLEKQVERIRQADVLRGELKELYRQYFPREGAYLKTGRAEVAAERRQLTTEEDRTKEAIRQKEGELKKLGRGEGAYVLKMRELEEARNKQQQQKDQLARKLGRLEGLVESKTRELTRPEANQRPVPFEAVQELAGQLFREIEPQEKTADSRLLQQALARIKEMLAQFLERFRAADLPPAGREELTALAAERSELEEAAKQLAAAEGEWEKAYRALRETADQENKTAREIERQIYEERGRLSVVESKLISLGLREDQVEQVALELKRELAEAAVLVDREVLSFAELAVADWPTEERQKQEERRRAIERLKIKLEDEGGSGTAVLAEYQEVTNRDRFLAKELTDLKAGEAALAQVITELQEKLAVEFTSGVKKINEEFDHFFKLMFGGGGARLVLVEEKRRRPPADFSEELALPTEVAEEAETGRPGVELIVNLPKKKIRGLEMLSGGERALASIALLFAMSQVNPPPFLILDETDAALDESNSRKYGELIAGLARQSQLILITHNRETMSRAGILYGITMGHDGVSRLLSIKLDEAAQWAKS